MVLLVNNFAQFSQKESKAASKKGVIFFDFLILTCNTLSDDSL